VGPFLVTVNRGSAHPFLSYAVPDDGALPVPEDVTALVEAYTDRGRTPRLEYLPALAPAVEPALLAAGFTVEARIPMMVCRPSDAVPQPVPADIELRVPGSRADRTRLARVQRAAFGDPEDEPEPEDRPEPEPDGEDTGDVPDGRGGLAVVARDTGTGEVVGGGMGTVVLSGTTELVGLAVAEAYRRRGIAAAVTWELSRLADRAGVTTAFLTPGGGVAERVYARVGYRPVGEMLHISKPA
jgi:GNAT superfamily N-acetyltransferase